jgi:hypothetical protein
VAVFTCLVVLAPRAAAAVVRSPAVSPVGAIAWIADDGINALPIAGEPRLLATTAPGTLQNLMITPGGKPVAWTANGVRQSTAL